MIHDLSKITRALPAGWQEEADAMDVERLRGCIVESEQNLKQAAEEMEANEEFQALKNAYREAAGPLADARNAQRAKIAYCLVLLEQRGAV